MAVERHSFEATAGGGPPTARPLTTAPGFGRPRPERLGEANGLHAPPHFLEVLEVETRISRSRPFEPDRSSFANLTLL